MINKFFLCKLISLTFLFLILCGVFPAHAEEKFRIPDCQTLTEWSSVLFLPENFTQAHEQPFVEQKKQSEKQLLSDDVMISVFGAVNGMWDHTRKKPLADAINVCKNEHFKNGNDAAGMKLTHANTIVGRPRPDQSTRTKWPKSEYKRAKAAH